MGEIPLLGANIRPADYKNKKFCFQIETPNRIYHIIASSEADMKDWMACLKEASICPEHFLRTFPVLHSLLSRFTFSLNPLSFIR